MGREAERARNIMCGCLLHVPPLGTWPATQACALTGNRTRDPLLCRPALNPLSHTNQGLIYKICIMSITFIITTEFKLKSFDEILLTDQSVGET